MKSKMIVAALAAVVMLGANFKSQADPWRHGHEHGYGGYGYWHRPHVAVRFYDAPRMIAPAPVVVSGTYGYPAPPAPPCNNQEQYYNNNYNANGYNNGYYNGNGYNQNGGYYDNGSNGYSQPAYR